jgi:hypothetical protein
MDVRSMPTELRRQRTLRETGEGLEVSVPPLAVHALVVAEL